MSPANDNIEFSSPGFDISAAASDKAENVVFEIGGGATTVEPPAAAQNTNNEPKEDSVMDEAESFKLQGNNAFKEQNWDYALENYTKAIEATPGMTAIELLKLQDDFLENQGKEMRKRYMDDEEERRKAGKSSATSKDKTSDEDRPKPNPPEPFVPPHHEHADKLSVYHCNRAAVYLHLQKYEQAVTDCDAAILWNPKYTKALMRRCQANEALDKTDKALEDAKMAFTIDPNMKLRQTVQRLEKIEAERMEKLKTETIDKLKELGNNILGNFGLSLDNFKAVQDPNTGSYSLSFGNNEPKSS
jgi:tetratricopeptide (TPR) repeat protein